MGDRGSTVVKVLYYNSEGRWFDPSGFLNDIKSLRPHCGPGVDSASNRNGYQEYFLWGKGGRCVPYHHPVPLSRNLGTLTSWNPLGHSRPVTGLIYLFIIRSFAPRRIVQQNKCFIFIYLLQLGCHPVAVVILHIHKIWSWLLINLSLEGYMRSM